MDNPDMQALRPHGAMRAVVYDGPGQLRVEWRSVPRPGPFDVRIQVARAGICGSDVNGYTGQSGRRAPGVVMGHEASGYIDQLGSAVRTGLEVGQPVALIPMIPCDGSCGHLLENRCLEGRVIGTRPELPGAFADALVIPQSRAFPLGSLPMAWGATIEPMAVGLQAVRQARVMNGDRILVMGGGMIGLAAAQAARMDGAAFVVVCDLVPGRRRVAEELGFRAVEPADVTTSGPFKRAIDAVGVATTLNAAINSVEKGGTVSIVGLGRPEVQVALFDIVGSERTLVGSSNYSDSVFAEAAARIASGELQVDELIGPAVSLEEIPAAVADLAEGSSTIKVQMAIGPDL